jgi:2-phosphosulfolactate phosphatase
VRVDVAFIPAEAPRVSVAVVVDVLRATSTIVQALEGGYRRVLCCAEIEEAVAARDAAGDAVLAGERRTEAIRGFDLGNSPRDFVEARAETLVLSTTNGTRAIVGAAGSSDLVLVGCLLNLRAVTAEAARSGGDVAVVCAGVEGRFTIDDAYCAGRIVAGLGGERSEAAEAAVRVAESFADPLEALELSAGVHREALGDDVAWCAREDVTAVVPALTGLVGPAAEVQRRA